MCETPDGASYGTYSIASRPSLKYGHTAKAPFTPSTLGARMVPMATRMRAVYQIHDRTHHHTPASRHLSTPLLPYILHRPVNAPEVPQFRLLDRRHARVHEYRSQVLFDARNRYRRITRDH